MNSKNLSPTAALIWSVADLLRGDFKQSQYGRVILPFTLLRRLECVLGPSKDTVLAEYERLKVNNLPEEVQEKRLLSVMQPDGLTFFNTSPINLSEISREHTKADLEKYVQSFSKNVREIFEHFKFDDFIGLLEDSHLLYRVVQKFAATDLSPRAFTNLEMGLIFGELNRRFAESSNETAGEHFTPRDIVNLTTSLVLYGDRLLSSRDGAVRSIYDPTVGTGGFLSSSIEYANELSPTATIRAFGQEVNPESYAICQANMLITGQEFSNVKLGDTLSNDKLPSEKFDYLMSNPPFGMNWKKIEREIKDEHDIKRFAGRFGPGLPRVSDSSLLFLMHLISKMRNGVDGSRIGIILNASPLITGGAGSGESEIRRYILEEDLLETIVALPTDMFYNTGIASYVCILTNKKKAERKGKVQLINGTSLSNKMRKPLGSKRHFLTEENIQSITASLHDFADMDTFTNNGKPLAAKVCDTYNFGYRRLTIERPLRVSAQITDAAIKSLRFGVKPLNSVMQAVYEKFGGGWTEDTYGSLDEAAVRVLIKTDFPELKAQQIKKVMDREQWLKQKALFESAKVIQAAFGESQGGKSRQSNDFNQFELNLKSALKSTDVKLDNVQRKQFIDAVSWKNPDAEPVIKNVKKTSAQPQYGFFEYKGKVVEFEQDSDFRDYENVPLNPSLTTEELVESYFMAEVRPYAPDAWINAEKLDKHDKEIGIVGYEINFKSYFTKNHARDQLLQGSLLRFKEIVIQDSAGLYVLEPTSGKIVEYSSLSEQRKQTNPARFNLLPERLLVEFYNIFLTQEEGKDWLESNFITGGTWRSISMTTWLNARISLPPIGNQSDLIDFWGECDAVLTRISLLKKSAFANFQSAQEQILPFQSVASRYEHEFSSMLPTPLAILWELAESKFHERDRCEAFIKFFEYLGLYLVSLVFGQSKPHEKCFYKRGGLIGLSMAFSHNRLKDYQDIITSTDGITTTLCRNEVIDFLKKATDLRNDIAHRGLPSAASVSAAKDVIDNLKDTMQSELRSFFDTSTLIKPMQAKFDGSSYIYEVEVLKGLGINPSKTALIKTSEPMVFGELYLSHGEVTTDESVRVSKLFPLLLVSETVPSSEIMGFYFYSDTRDDKLRFVCPYPNVETYKFLPEKLIKENLNND